MACWTSSRRITRLLLPDRLAATTSEDNPATALSAYVAARAERGDLVTAEPAVIVGVLQRVLPVPMFADPALLPKILDPLIDIVAAGLTAGQS